MNHVEAQGLSTLIRSLADDGITVLLIEHNVKMVLATCSRIMVLNFGEVIAGGDPATVARDPAVIDAYLGSDTAADTTSDTQPGFGSSDVLTTKTPEVGERDD
jgi:branched-chain amino acid transport system permease protein